MLAPTIQCIGKSDIVYSMDVRKGKKVRTVVLIVVVPRIRNEKKNYQFYLVPRNGRLYTQNGDSVLLDVQ